MKKIISTCERTNTNKDDFKSLAQKFGFEYIENFPSNQGFRAKEMKEIIQDSSICIVGDDSIDNDVINTATKLKEYSIPKIIDPVMVSRTGANLIEDSAINAYKS